MRFEELFDDLAAQAAATGERIMWDEANEMVRAETIARTLLDRLAPGSTVRLRLRGSHDLEGRVERVGRDVVVVTSAFGQGWAVRAPAVRQVKVIRPASPRVGERVQLSALLRTLARSRPSVTLAEDDGHTQHGRLLGVGSDHIEVALGTAERVLIALDGVSALGWRAPGLPEAGLA
ncbi:MAG: hypothetical protein ACTII7_00360 [Galactobacter sp.]